MAKIIRVNMTDLQLKEEAVSQDLFLRGGRGVISKIMNEKRLNDLRGD